jgi:hypothetical protein
VFGFFSSGDQSQEAKTRFGYIRDMKVEKKLEILLYFWLCTGNYQKNNLMILEKKNSFKI